MARRARRRARRAGALAVLALALLGAQPALAAAPDPGGDENARISLPVPGKEFGFNGLFNVDSFFNDALDPSQQGALIATAGGDAARMPLEWWGMEPQRDTWNEAGWARNATTYNALLAEGIRPHLVLMNAPPWARDPGAPQTCLSRTWCHYPPARDMLAEWDQFVAAVERRFPEATIEVWNEENSLGMWRSGVDPARYAELLAHAWDAARSVNPDARLMMGGLASSVPAATMSVRDFLSAAYGASPSLRGHTDAINFHAYPWGHLGAGTPFAQLFQDVRSVRARHGDASTPLFVSETGATTTGPMAVSPREQSSMVLGAVRKMLTMPDVEGVLVHTLVDRPEYPIDDHERGFGLLRAGTELPLHPKPAFCRLARAAGQTYAPCPAPPNSSSSRSSRPHTRLVAPRRKRISDHTPKFRFVATHRPHAAGAPAAHARFRFACRLDTHRWRHCASPFHMRRLGIGGHRLRVRARDAAGHRERRPAKLHFRIVKPH